MPGKILTVPPPHRATESTAAWTTFSVDPTKSAVFGPTVSVRRCVQFGSTGSPEVARGVLTGTEWLVGAAELCKAAEFCGLKEITAIHEHLSRERLYPKLTRRCALSIETSARFEPDAEDYCWM